MEVLETLMKIVVKVTDVVALARQFREHPEIRYGLTTMCIGLGMGGTLIWENPHHTEGADK